MKRIGITQRVVYFEDIEERRDMLDQRWYDFAQKAGLRLLPIPNQLQDLTDYIEDLDIEGFIFSGGNNVGLLGKELIKGKTIQDDDVAYERDKTEQVILEGAIKEEKPVIGVCRGLQFINAFFKGKQNEVDSEIHVANDHNVQFTDGGWQQIYGSSNTVNSYHRFGIFETDLAGQLTPTAKFEEQVEAFQHQQYKIFGMMWHPERYSSFRKSDINLFKKKLDI